MKFLHELAPDVPLNVRRIVGRIERLSDVLAREAEPLCTEVEALHTLQRLPDLFGDEGAKELIGFVLKLSQLSQATPGGEALVSEHFIAQALASEPAKVGEPAALKLSQPSQATPGGEALVSEHFIAQALASEPAKVEEPAAKSARISKKPN